MSESALDRSSALPLWAQLAQDLRRRMADGEFDEQFPTEEACARSYGVSRQTVREALRRIEADGLLVRERGRGTTLARPEFEQPLHAIYSLSSSLRSQGVVERSEVLAIGTMPAGDQGEHLGLAEDDPVVYLERLRFAGDEPLALMRSWLPTDVAGGLVESDLESGSLYDLLADRCDIRVTGGWERMRPCNPPPAERRLLCLPKREAALTVQRLALAGDRPIEWRVSTIRGDRYSFKAEWSETVPAR
ncbi:MAG: GntR family transcriptional regulator [Actinomycetota bacterium]|jgi:GntR family transcriptional regulator|nr:GntR family transcriptional regulator [Actinomycetota bacterium]MDA8341301.1 GntR family transcriptional regulator [Actinomycetota bacterium]